MSQNESILSPPLLTTTSNTNTNSKLNNLEKNLDELMKKIDLLEKKNLIQEKIISTLESKLESIDELAKSNEKYIVNQDSYSRRNNVEFYNIPENVKQNEVERYVLNLLKSVKININSYDIVAVHRIGRKSSKRPRNVIVRFLNRKNAYKCLGINNQLKSLASYRSIFVSENLCPYNKKIFNALYKLKKNNAIKSVWSYNGNVYYQVDESEDYYQAESIEDIEDLFEEENQSGNEALSIHEENYSVYENN